MKGEGKNNMGTKSKKKGKETSKENRGKKGGVRRERNRTELSLYLQKECIYLQRFFTS